MEGVGGRPEGKGEGVAVCMMTTMTTMTTWQISFPAPQLTHYHSDRL